LADDPTNDLPNGHVEQPPEVRRAVAAIARTRVTEVLLVFVAVLVALGLVGTAAWNTFKVRSLTQQNVKAQDFGLKAIRCILDNFSDHRWSNQEFHDSLATFLHAPVTPHVPLPRLPSEAEFAEDCGAFNRGGTHDGATTTSR
jgi:hypothetical protein